MSDTTVDVAAEPTQWRIRIQGTNQFDGAIIRVDKRGSGYEVSWDCQGEEGSAWADEYEQAYQKALRIGTALVELNRHRADFYAVAAEVQGLPG